MVTWPNVRSDHVHHLAHRCDQPVVFRNPRSHRSRFLFHKRGNKRNWDVYHYSDHIVHESQGLAQIGKAQSCEYNLHTPRNAALRILFCLLDLGQNYRTIFLGEA
jgi:hypothetical protein